MNLLCFLFMRSSIANVYFILLIVSLSRDLTEGLQPMREGSKCRFYISNELQTADQEMEGDVFGAFPPSVIQSFLKRVF